MPGSADRDSELFARALDGGPDGRGGRGEPGGPGGPDGTGGPGGSGAGGPEPDERLSRELAVVSLLVAAGQRALPDDAARDRMRERIFAGLAGLAGPRAEGVQQPGQEREREPGLEREPEQPQEVPDVVTPIAARRRSAVVGVQGRLLVAAAAALCVLVTLSGMSLVLARDALPGDALYGVKRSAESAELGLTFGDEPRGFKHLQFATARIDEIEALAARAGGAGSDADTGLFLTALQSFDTDAAAGSRLLLETLTNGAGGQLATLRGWAEQQRQRLGEATAAMPLGAAGRAGGSIVLLDRVIGRVSALQQRLPCSAVTSGARDDVGPLPADGQCVPAASGPAQSSPVPASVTSTTVSPGAQQPGLVVPGSPGGELPGGIGPLDPGLTGPATGGPLPDTASRSQSTTSSPPAITVPLPLPVTSVPPLLPGLPGLEVG
ncbi:MAG TPA: DUF5667 domain-containing protein [Pseudonocardiaceae bacterium]